MKKTVLMILIMFLCAIPVHAVEAPKDISAQSAILIDGENGRVLWEKDANRKMLIASTTKIMTALIALEHCDLDESVFITQSMADVEGSSMYLQAGKHYTVRELLYGLMLASGNDAATAIASHVAGDDGAFALLMNRKAAELGMHDTSFENPHGLDGEHHYSTAADMARLAMYAMENETFAAIVGTRHTSIQGLTYVNHNKLLWQCEGVIGVKTGYTIAAGRTLVTCCERNGQRVICVTLSARNDWEDHKRLLNWVYADYAHRPVLEGNESFSIPLMDGNNSIAEVIPSELGRVFISDRDVVSYEIELPPYAFLPIMGGESAGRLIAKVDGVVVCEVPLIYKDNYKMEIKRSHDFSKVFWDTSAI